MRPKAPLKMSCYGVEPRNAHHTPLAPRKTTQCYSKPYVGGRGALWSAKSAQCVAPPPTHLS